MESILFVWITMGWLTLIVIVKCHDQHFIPFGSPLRRSYFRRMHPFHPINDDDLLTPFLITRAPETVEHVRITNEDEENLSESEHVNKNQHHRQREHSNEPLNLNLNSEMNSESAANADKGENHIFDSDGFWNVSDKPVMANGHVGFIPYGDAIYMNGLYNGYMGTSHRARIPNYANIQFETCSRSASLPSSESDLNKFTKCSYALDIFNAVFRTRTNLNNEQGHFAIEQIQYAHRYYDGAIVNRIHLQRNSIINNITESFQIRLSQVHGGDSDDLTIKLFQPKIIANKSVIVVDAMTTTREDTTFQNDFSNVSILYETVPELIELPLNKTSIEFRWVTIIGTNTNEVEKLFEQLQKQDPNDVYTMHTNEWHKFWQENAITVNGDDELSKVIQSSLYAMASSLPSLNTSQPRSIFYGLSPSGLGLGKLLTDYEGHSFWDTEIWMHPVILLLEPQWSRELLNYRFIMRNAARDNAIATGYKGYRYPWESAYTGRDVTQPDYPEIVKYQQHITGDIGHALRQHFFATHDYEWFRRSGCDLAYGTAQFWESRVQFNTTSNRYDITGIMGPDEDHYNISNNAYTNVVAALNLHFASISNDFVFRSSGLNPERHGLYASCICHQLDPIKYPVNMDWSSIAKRITLLYDRQLDYNPQYDGYNLNVKIKQADVTLLGYPLQYTNIQTTTRRNNLNFYENVTRANGPAMTWSMHTIGHLDVDPMPPSAHKFQKTYAPYVRQPFYVWNEYVNGVENGASNFITGAGGFLQLIIYGYAGIRINADSLTIEKSTLPPNTTQLKLNGIRYMQASLEIIINGHDVRVTIRGNNGFHVFIDNIEQNPMNTTFIFTHQQKLKLKAKQKSNTDTCPLPEDTIDPVTIN